MNDRDTFAAAALTGLIANGDYSVESTPTLAYRMADAMLRERGKEQGHEDNRSQPSKRKWVHGCTGILRRGEVGMEETDDGPVYKIGDGKTEWDDLPTLVKSTNHDDAATGEPSGGVGFSSGSRTGPINRTPERQSPDRECGESSLRDVPQLDNSRAAGGPEHHISDRPKPVKDAVSDRPQPINADRLAALERLGGER